MTQCECYINEGPPGVEPLPIDEAPEQWIQCPNAGVNKHNGVWLCDRCYDMFNPETAPEDQSFEQACKDAGCPQQEKQ